MQSSVRPEPPPRLGDLPRTVSNDLVQVSKVVSLTSRQAPTPPVQRSIYSPMSPAHVQRPQRPHSIPSGIYATQVAHWNSLSKNSEKPSIYQMRAGQPRPQTSSDHELLESNRESMKALSDFLMTREPPPSNWMSAQSSDDDKSLNSFKKSAFKLFGGKSKKKKSKQPRLLRLPDSAVAARTSRGARHIAISIPLVHDHMEPVRVPTPTPRHVKREPRRERTDRAAVHVLKPLTELRESMSSQFGSPPRSRNGMVTLGDTPGRVIINPLAANPPAETLRQSPALEGAYTDNKLSPRIEPSNAPKYDPKRTQSYVAVSPTAMQRQDSQRSMDPRHSGGTMYSTISIATPQAGHSRQPSSVSTAPSTTATSATVIPGIRLDLPPRNSSISKHTTISMQTETEFSPLQLQASSTLLNDKEGGKLHLPSPPNSPIQHGNESTISGGSPVSPHNAVVATAETVRKYSGAGLDGPQVVRSTTPRSLRQTQVSAPPNKSLPDLPIGRSKTAPPFRPGSGRENDGARLSRQERVKQRKQRDIEALRLSHIAVIRPPLSESNDTNVRTPLTPTSVPLPSPARTSRITTPPRNPKRSGISSAEKRRLANSLSPIMLVADLPPCTNFVSVSDQSSNHPRNRKSLESQSIVRPIPSPLNLKGVQREKEEQQTPPRSPITPILSDFPQIPNHHSNRTLSHARSRSFSPIRYSSPTLRGRVGTQTQSLRSNVLETRRQERRTKRNLSLREKELNARLCKIEKDNAMLLATLSGIARSFGHLHRVSRSEGVRGREVGDGEMGMEPVMRELQGRVPRVSGEGFMGRELDELEMEEDEF